MKKPERSPFPSFDDARARLTRGRSAAWLAAIAFACSPGASQLPAADPAAATPQPLEVDVKGDSVQVFVPEAGCAPGALCDDAGPVKVRLRLANGRELNAMTDERGYALLTPTPQILFENAELGMATVQVARATAEVDLTGLIEDAKRNHPGQWQAFFRQDSLERGEADRAVGFSGTIYRDKAEQPLVKQCLPSGAELCFDGIDNDCDGRYDDTSCGYSTGVLQWTVTWKGDADLDLRVIGPDDEEVNPSTPRAGSAKLIMDRHCGPDLQRADCAQGNVENVYVPAHLAPTSGTYQARVEVVDPKTTRRPIAARLSGRIGDHTWYNDLRLAPFPSVDFQVAFAVGADRDGDSVTDEHDACPEERGCWFGDLKYRGCADRDGDSVPDSIDACPDKTGIQQADNKLSGCPIEFGGAWVTTQGIQIHKRIQFATGKAILRPESRKFLQHVAQAIRAYPGSVSRLAIDGHTDYIGEPEDNLTLSEARTDAVMAELVQLGISKELFAARAFGESRPRADNESVQGRQVNRRVEFVVLRPAPRTAECW